MSSDVPSGEPERVIIEASMLAITLLFIITQVREELRSPQAIAAMSALAAMFTLSALFATFAMWRRWRPKQFLDDLALFWFVIALFLLLLVFWTISQGWIQLGR